LKLPDRPKYLFCATDMTFGQHWVFEKTGVGDDVVGYIQPTPDWPVARAVAASSCFPPAFGPLTLDISREPLTPGTYIPPEGQPDLRKSIHLTDGGVVDNLGVEKVWATAGTLLVSDGGATFQFGWKNSLLWRLQRYMSIADNQGTIVRKRWLLSNFVNGAIRGAYWGIDSAVAHYYGPDAVTAVPTNAYDEQLVKERICTVRTDLDAFTLPEIAVLENHGYTLAEAACQQHARHLITRPNTPFSIPNQEFMDAKRVQVELKDSSTVKFWGRGFWRPRLFRS
jgi:NTE family protein